MIRRAGRFGWQSRLAIGVALALGLAGCGQTSHEATRYKGEQLMWKADHEETQVRLRDEKPDSATLLELREPYLEVARTIKVPTVSATASKKEKDAARDIRRLVGNAELQAARLAVQANRPDLAMETMKKVQAMAGNDTLLLRRADFFLVGTLRQYKRYDEAVALMRSMLERYPPLSPDATDEEDAILAIPESMVRMYRDLNDSTAASAALDEGEAYYHRVLSQKLPPILDAQVRSRLVRVELEKGDWDSGLKNVAILRRLAAQEPSLKNLEPEIRYSEAKLHMLHTGKVNPNASVALLDQVVKDFPRSPFAARALLDAGVLLEQHGNKVAALERYRQITNEYDSQPGVAPQAFFRRAMLEDQLGDWERAKSLLEGIPVRYPETMAALEAPLAIVNRYARVGQKDAAMAAVNRAITTYRGLIERDTTSNFVPLYRWCIVKCQFLLGDKAGVLQTIDVMAVKDVGHPITQQALLNGARIAHELKQDPRAKRYLQTFLANYPKSPAVPDVKRELAKLSPAAAGAKGG